MSNDYRPRRCSKRWLDGDCPPGVLAIIDSGPNDPAPERYDVIYADVSTVNYGRMDEHWMGGFSLSEYGAGLHFEWKAHEVAAYRYRMKHRYAKWSTLPEAVKNAVRRDLAEVDA